MSRLGLFEGFGVELEYMIVDRETLAVAPVADRLLSAAAGAPDGEPVNEVALDGMAWSNELVLHVVEIKVDGPAPSLTGLAERFQASVGALDGFLEPWGCRLLGGAMHPWFDPETETRLWPHDHGPIYRAFDRIFGCRGHGWSNLQSAHLNLPFAGDEEFGRLHGAIRLLLPLLPALAAASPVLDGRPTGLLDNRLEVYRTNSRRLVSVTGRVIPEPVYTREDYGRRIFAPMMADVGPLDPEGVLEEEFLNARGAIARFSRGSIEIRVIDVQECPAADLAILEAAVAVLKLLVEETWTDRVAQQAWPVEPLAELFEAAIVDAEEARVASPELLETFGFPGRSASLGELWHHLAEAAEAAGHLEAAWRRGPLGVILEHGPLARRLLRALGKEPDRGDLEATWRRLAACLAEGRMFL